MRNQRNTKKLVHERYVFNDHLQREVGRQRHGKLRMNMQPSSAFCQTRMKQSSSFSDHLSAEEDLFASTKDIAGAEWIPAKSQFA